MWNPGIKALERTSVVMCLFIPHVRKRRLGKREACRTHKLDKRRCTHCRRKQEKSKSARAGPGAPADIPHYCHPLAFFFSYEKSNDNYARVRRRKTVRVFLYPRDTELLSDWRRASLSCPELCEDGWESSTTNRSGSVFRAEAKGQEGNRKMKKAYVTQGFRRKTLVYGVIILSTYEQLMHN